jgi:hypothetical protein
MYRSRFLLFTSGADIKISKISFPNKIEMLRIAGYKGTIS